jgi:hypothetical protein
LVNLLQTAVETVLFYHPGVWYLSGVIREERENCCDDLVVQTSGEARRYARALAATEELRWRSPPLGSPAVSGGTLYRRIRRLVAGAGEVPSGGWVAGTSTLFLVVALMGAALWPALAEARPTEPAGRVVASASADWDRGSAAEAQERLAERWRAGRAAAAERAGRQHRDSASGFQRSRNAMSRKLRT